MIPSDTPVGMDNCGIATTAMLAGVSYAEAQHLFLTICGKQDYTTVWDRTDVMQALGLTVLEEKHYGLKPTLTQWLRTHYDPAFAYQVAVTGHVVAIQQGWLFDQRYRHGVLAVRSPYQRKRVLTHIKLGDKHDYRRSLHDNLRSA